LCLPLIGGKVYTYAAGTNDLKATYTDPEGTTAAAQPDPVEHARRTAIFWSGAYRVEVPDEQPDLQRGVATFTRAYKVEVRDAL
jgi:hypothetical protein